MNRSCCSRFSLTSFQFRCSKCVTGLIFCFFLVQFTRKPSSSNFHFPLIIPNTIFGRVLPSSLGWMTTACNSLAHRYRFSSSVISSRNNVRLVKIRCYLRLYRVAYRFIGLMCRRWDLTTENATRYFPLAKILFRSKEFLGVCCREANYTCVEYGKRVAVKQSGFLHACLKNRFQMVIFHRWRIRCVYDE